MLTDLLKDATATAMGYPYDGLKPYVFHVINAGMRIYSYGDSKKSIN
jgi:hypothetical protein